MKKALALLAAVALLCLGGTAQATVTIETVAVGDAGNSADTTGYGAVSHNYNIGKYEVTVGQYTEYLNYKQELVDAMAADAKLTNHIGQSGSGTLEDPYHYVVDPGYENDPVIKVSFWDACRFVNWLNNSQGNGDTETGAYTLSSYDGSAGGNITRNPGATWFIPTIDEWYKAAYYIGGTDTGYFTEPTNSVYGTSGQYGNGWEWTESVLSVGSADGRVLGGGGDVLGGAGFTIQASVPVDFKGSSLGDPSKSGGPSLPWAPGIPLQENMGFGFRVGAVPEPSSIVALAGGLISLLGIRRRRA